MRSLLGVLLICLLVPVVVFSQDNPLSTFNKTAYGAVKNILVHSARKIPI
jgi:hypothetical protein